MCRCSWTWYWSFYSDLYPVIPKVTVFIIAKRIFLKKPRFPPNCLWRGKPWGLWFSAAVLLAACPLARAAEKPGSWAAQPAGCWEARWVPWQETRQLRLSGCHVRSRRGAQNWAAPGECFNLDKSASSDQKSFCGKVSNQLFLVRSLLWGIRRKSRWLKVKCYYREVCIFASSHSFIFHILSFNP